VIRLSNNTNWFGDHRHRRMNRLGEFTELGGEPLLAGVVEIDVGEHECLVFVERAAYGGDRSRSLATMSSPSWATRCIGVRRIPCRWNGGMFR